MEKSHFYEEINNFTWYPVKMIDPFGKEIINKPEPSEYIEKYSLNFNDTVPTSPLSFWTLDSAAYKFTDKALYIYDIKEKGLQAVFFYNRIDMNKFFVFNNMDWNRTTFKKIDSAVIKKS